MTAETTAPRKWLYGLAADEWFHLACEGQDSEVAPCCGNIGQLREWLQGLASCQGLGESYMMCGSVIEAYEAALSDHDAIADASAFPLLHRVMAGVRAEYEPCTTCGGRGALHRLDCSRPVAEG